MMGGGMSNRMMYKDGKNVKKKLKVRFWNVISKKRN